MQAWEEFLLRQEKELGVETVKKWLRTLKVLRFDACNLYLEAKDSFQALWFEEHIRAKVTNTLQNNNNKKIRVHVTIGTRSGSAKDKKPAVKSAATALPPFHIQFDSTDPLCTFEHFVVGESHAIAYRLLKGDPSDNTGDKPIFNPIYLCGPSGCGKTHLLMAYAKELREKGKKAIYVRSETFTEHVVSAIRASEMGIFRQSYRKADVLLIDDVHLLSRKGATQEELFHTFNALHLEGKQIVLAAKCPPGELQEIEPRLVSRFEWGIVLPLESASGNEIEQILKKKAAALQYPLSPKISEYLIESFPSSSKAAIRALEALILRSHVQQGGDILFKPMSVQLAKHYLSDLLLAEKQNAITADRIILSCSEHYGIRPEDILGKAQTRDCAQPRQIAMYLCRSNLKLPYIKIGEIFGRDHSTVMSSVKLVQKSVDERQEDFVSALSAIEKKFGH